jgi:lipopolysaccharide export system permease protein
MRILTRLLIRAHLGPFFFALTALTGLLFLNAVAQRMEDLAGKGLTWDVIVEFLVLSLPHTVALTLPMAVLVAVLHAFTEMTAANEITAIKAGGIPPRRILVPMLIAGTLMGGLMLYFNDRVLPESNHRLKNLLLDINRKSPTFALREQVVNRVDAGETGKTYFIRAGRIDNAASRMEDVSIIDGSDLTRRRVTYADSAFMAFNEARTDLFLTLHHGVLLELDLDRPGGFQKLFFERQILPLRGVGNEMDRRAGASDRGDREMTLGMLAEQAERRRQDVIRLGEENRRETVENVRLALGMPLETRTDVEEEAPPGFEAPAPMVRAVEGGSDRVTQRLAALTAANRTRVEASVQSMHRYQVEYHKKFTLAFACIVFVLVGIPLAIRYPRGGLGLVIAASSAIFAVYWVGLIAGEDIADRGIAPPWVTMWVPNLIFLTLGLILVKRMGREAATMRGGGWDDLWWSLTRPFRRGTEGEIDEVASGGTAPEGAA